MYKKTETNEVDYLKMSGAKGRFKPKTKKKTKTTLWEELGIGEF